MENVYSLADFNDYKFLPSLTDTKQKTFKKKLSRQTKSKTLFSRPPKILLVEDNIIIQKVNIAMLTNLGCEVDLADNGLKAVSMFKNGYDLIFMDVGLPELDGISATKVIRCNEPKNRPNIIAVLTAFGDTVEKKCLDAGANGLYTKPLLQNDLLEVLKYWLPHLLKTNNTALN
ncbi:MAG: response regulator [Gammaproteobacteria bacterium]